MVEVWSQMLWPLVACFILVGIHAYLGIHVIARKVIFVDLALAQIAGLGAVYGVFLGLSFETDLLLIKLVSVIFTLLGAVLFSMTRTDNEQIPHEAIIGIIYAAALSMTVLMTANLPHGADEVQQMLAGSILWVQPKEVLYTGLLYGVIGLFHWLCRKQFFALSHELALRHHPTGHARLWDFLFYATFGVVVTSSVGIGGVLLVFGFLVIPSVIGVMLAHSTRARLVIGWSCGVLASIVGVIFSYYLDLPSGPTIVVFLGLFLAIVAVYKELRGARYHQGIMHGTLIIGLGALFVFMPQLVQFSINQQQEKVVMHHQLGHDDERSAIVEKMLTQQKGQILEALNEIEDAKLHELLPKTLPLMSSSDALIREKAISLQASLKNYAALPVLKRIFPHEKDDFLKLGIAETLLSLGDVVGFSFLAPLLGHPSELVRSDAADHVKKWLKEAPTDEKGFRYWLKQHRVVFDEATKAYRVGK